MRKQNLSKITTNITLLVAIISSIIATIYIARSYIEPELPLSFTNKISLTPIHPRKEFCDMQEAHIRAATQYGINPINHAIEESAIPKGLELVAENDYFQLDKLTHSQPYLTPNASKLITTIGKAFQDSLRTKEAPSYKIIVTSLLRTDELVKKLRRRNLNSSQNSAHRYGTTFDISYVRFVKLSDTEIELTDAQLKGVLCEVLKDLRDHNRCFVKHEVKQGCFHITVNE